MPNRIIDLWGEPIEVAVSSASTNHASCTVIQTLPPGGCTPVLTHPREDEVLVVLAGDHKFFDGAAWQTMRVGQLGYGVRGRPHAYRNVGRAPGRMLVVAAPGALEEYLAAVAPLSLPRDRAHFDDISRMYGVTVLSPDATPQP